MISIVSVFNDQDVLNNYLLKGLNKTVNQLILIDNSNYQFKSAAEALNYGARKADGDYIMFIHQDVHLASDNWLSDVEESLDSLANLGIAGVAGKRIGDKEILSNLKHGEPPHFAGVNRIDEPEKVETLDECLLIIPRKVFDEHKFDDGTDYGWHLYGVDYCLNIQTLGFDVYVLPNPVHHKSSGDPFSGDYYSALSRLLKKYKNNFRVIHTTVFNWNTNYPIFIQKLWFYFDRKIYSGLKTRLSFNN